MNRRSLRWGVTASGALAGFYVAVLALSGGWEHLVDLVPLLGAAGIAGFLFDWRIPMMVAGLAINSWPSPSPAVASPTSPMRRPERCRAQPDPCSRWGRAVLVLAACGGDDPPVTAAGLDTRTTTVGEVEVTITPSRIDATGAEFDITLDTHSVDLDLDIADQTTLTIDDQPWTNPTWDGTGAGSHHLEGTLAFTAAGPAAGDAVLTLDGLDEPVTARWALPEGT